MGEKRKRDLFPPPPANWNIFRALIEQIRLSWALLLDNRVSLWLKLIPVLGVAYCFSPISLVLFFIPVIGQIDDIAAVLISLIIFNQLAPAGVVADHLMRLRYQSLPPNETSRSDDVILMDEDEGAPRASDDSTSEDAIPMGSEKYKHTSHH
ncbi:MAG TPA: DUF1232 domain-containing protein [Aggregatilineales bacterium]|nr:DUF1232 domain-containing protein [Aggregatilineales bacterium]